MDLSPIYGRQAMHAELQGLVHVFGAVEVNSKLANVTSHPLRHCIQIHKGLFLPAYPA